MRVVQASGGGDRENAAVRHPAEAVALSRVTYMLLLAGAFLIYASANSPVPIAGELRAGVGLRGEDAALFMLPFAAGFATGCIGWFLTARHSSPSTLIPLALSLVAVGTVLLVSSGTPEVAAFARFTIGLASAAFPAATQAFISHAVPVRLRGRLIGGFAAAVVAGGVLGQALVGVLADLASAGAALLVVCTVAPLVTAVALRAALPGALHTGDEAPRAVPHLIASQWPPLALAALMFGTYWLMLTQLAATVRADRFGLSAAEAGVLPILGIAGIITTLGGGWWSDRVGPRAPVVATAALGVVAIALTIPAQTPLWLFGAAFGLFIAAYWGFLAPGASEVAARSHGRDRQPAMMAFYAAAWLGAAAFTAVGTVMPGWLPAAAIAVAAWLVSAVIAIATFGRADA
jgi:MFS transporter, YNFM family, putative membrane transport protein